MVSSIPITRPARERRREVRVTFSPVRRPRLRLEGGTYEVLRVRHADPARPLVGDRMAGDLEWPGLERPLPITGRVVRVEPSEFALRCDHGQLPMAHIMAEVARRRDAQDLEH